MSQNTTADELLTRLNNMDQASEEAWLKYRDARASCSLAKRRWLVSLDIVERANTAWLVAMSKAQDEAAETPLCP